MAVVFATAYSVTNRYPRLTGPSDSWLAVLANTTFDLSYTLLSLLLLVVFSAVFMAALTGGRRDYSANGKLLCYRGAWQYGLSSLAVVLVGDHVELMTLVSLLLLVWFLFLFAVALSIANSIPLKRCWLPAIGALLCTTAVMYPVTLLSIFA